MAEKERFGYDKKDAARETGSSGKSTARAWHDARDDAAASGQLDERNRNKTSDSEEGRKLHEHFEKIKRGE